MKKFFLFPLVLLLTLFGCNAKTKKIVMKPGAVLLDVRSQAEFRTGHLEGAVNIPHDEISGRIAEAVPEKNTPLYLYCRSGRRVKIAMETLRKLNYTQLYNLGGLKEAQQLLQLPVLQK